MSNISWLPPLNNPHRPSQTTVKIHQNTSSVSNQSGAPNYSELNLFTFVTFKSDSQDTSTRQKRFPGLENRWTIGEPNIGIVEFSVRSCLPSIESDENRITFSQKHLDEQEFSSPEPISSSGRELFNKIDNFMREAVAKTGNSQNVLFELEIRVEIVIPDDELKAWHLWFEGKVASDPDFQSEFRRALSRPREMLDEGKYFIVVEADGNSFSACLEELSPGSEVTKLSCGHMFDESCRRRWLQTNNVCPICRSDVQN